MELASKRHYTISLANEQYQAHSLMESTLVGMIKHSKQPDQENYKLCWHREMACFGWTGILV